MASDGQLNASDLELLGVAKNLLEGVDTKAHKKTRAKIRRNVIRILDNVLTRASSQKQEEDVQQQEDDTEQQIEVDAKLARELTEDDTKQQEADAKLARELAEGDTKQQENTKLAEVKVDDLQPPPGLDVDPAQIEADAKLAREMAQEDAQEDAPAPAEEDAPWEEAGAKEKAKAEKRQAKKEAKAKARAHREAKQESARAQEQGEAWRCLKGVHDWSECGGAHCCRSHKCSLHHAQGGRDIQMTGPCAEPEWCHWGLKCRRRNICVYAHA